MSSAAVNKMPNPMRCVMSGAVLPATAAASATGAIGRRRSFGCDALSGVPICAPASRMIRFDPSICCLAGVVARAGHSTRTPGKNSDAWRQGAGSRALRIRALVGDDLAVVGQRARRHQLDLALELGDRLQRLGELGLRPASAAAASAFSVMTSCSPARPTTRRRRPSRDGAWRSRPPARDARTCR